MLSVGDLVQPGAIGSSYGMGSYTVVPGTTPSSAAPPGLALPGSGGLDPSAAAGTAPAANLATPPSAGSIGPADPTAVLPGASPQTPSYPAGLGGGLPGVGDSPVPASPAAQPAIPFQSPTAVPTPSPTLDPAADAGGSSDGLQTIASALTKVVGS